MEIVHMAEDRILFRGPQGEVALSRHDEIGWKLAMLLEAECDSPSPSAVAPTYGYGKQRYYQLRCAFIESGCVALASRKRGPKGNYRRDPERVHQIIRYRFLDPQASAEVIAQKLRQDGLPISIRSVYRVIEHYGLQKKGSINVAPRPRR